MRILTGLSLLALVVAVAVAATGNLAGARKLLGPGGSDGAQTARTPVGAAHHAAVAQQLAVLYRQAQLDAAADPGSSARQMAARLATSEPAMGVGEPVQRGGVQVRVRGGDVELCAAQTPAVLYTCARGPLKGGQPAFADGPTLRAARRLAARAARHRRAGGPAPAQPDGAAPPADVVQRAREAARAAGG